MEPAVKGAGQVAGGATAAMEKPKPVVIYLHRYPPEIEAYQWPALGEVMAALAPAYEVVYMCMGPPGGRRDPELRRHLRVMEAPFPVDQTRGRDKWFKTLRWYLHAGRMLKKIRALQPAVVICQEVLPILPGRVVRLGFPTILPTADWWWSILLGHWRWGRWLADRLERREVRGWNRDNVTVFACTQAGARLLAARGLDPARVAIVNMPRNPGMFRPLAPAPDKAELGLEADCRHAAIFGIIRKGKGYEQLLDWWRLAVARHPDWRLVIIGGAGGEAWCRREIARRGLETVTHMTGWLATKQEVNRWLNAMDAILVPRRNSSDNQGAIPSALFNGLSTGRPVVATALPGIAEIVRDGVEGYLYAPDDERSFLEALERALADPAAADRIGRAGLARATECFDPRNVGKAYREWVDRMN
jgi:glycosyltransferase involved in cell wall biosynthesis